MVNIIRMASAILFGTIPISMKGKYTFEPHVVLCEFYSMSTEEFARFMKCLEYETQLLCLLILPVYLCVLLPTKQRDFPGCQFFSLEKLMMVNRTTDPF